MAEITSILAILGALELANLGISVVNARQLGEDTVARERSRSAHSRINEHLRTHHQSDDVEAVDIGEGADG